MFFLSNLFNLLNSLNESGVVGEPEVPNEPSVVREPSVVEEPSVVRQPSVVGEPEVLNKPKVHIEPKALRVPNIFKDLKESGESSSRTTEKMLKYEGILRMLFPGIGDLERMGLLSRNKLIELVIESLKLYPPTDDHPEVIEIEDSPVPAQKGDSPDSPVDDEPQPMSHVCFSCPPPKEVPWF